MNSPTHKHAYSFKEGLAMMAAKDVGIDPYLAAEAGEDARSVLADLRRAKAAKGQEKAKHLAAAQTELRKLNPKQHGKLINALQAKVLALQGRGGDTAVAHLEPGEMVIPRRVLTPELAQLIAAEAAARGIDPKRLFVGSGSVNPATDTEEFGWLGDRFKEVGGGVKEALRNVGASFGFGNTRKPEPVLEGLENPVTTTRRKNSVWLSDQGDEIPGTHFSRMIPTETGAEGRMFTDEQVKYDNTDLNGPAAPVSRGFGIDYRKMTDADLLNGKEQLEKKAQYADWTGMGLAWVGGLPGLAIGASSSQVNKANEDVANEVQRELDWRKYMRSHR